MITLYNDNIDIPKDIPVTDRDKLGRYIKEAYEVNKNFWKIDIPIKVKPVYSREDFNKEAGYATRKWNCAFTSDEKIIVIFAPSVFGRLTSHKLSSYLQVLIHETNHIFFMNLVGACTPLWLFEGLAMEMAGQDKRRRGQANVKYLRYSFAPENFEESDEDAEQFYRSSYLFTHMLIKKKGLRAIMDFLNSYKKYRTEKTYAAWYKRLKI